MPDIVKLIDNTAEHKEHKHTATYKLFTKLDFTCAEIEYRKHKSKHGASKIGFTRINLNRLCESKKICCCTQDSP